MKCYRKLLRIPYTTHRTNESVNEELTLKVGKEGMLVSIIRKQQLKWFGLVTRHNNKLSFAHNLMHGRAPGKRGRGRPRVMWIQSIIDYTELSAIDAVRVAQDREV